MAPAPSSILKFDLTDPVSEAYPRREDRVNELPAARRKDELDGLVRETARVKVRAADAMFLVSGLVCTEYRSRVEYVQTCSEEPLILTE